MKADLSRITEEICRYATAAFWDRIAVKAKDPIVQWVSRRVDLRYDVTSNANGLVQLYPYQVLPLECTEAPEVREVTLMWGQRMGKSTVWKFSLLKRLYDGGLSGLIIYPTMELGLKTNQDTVLPLITTLPNIKSDLATRGGKKKDSYHLPSARSVLYFIGGGAQVVSYTANWGVLDESDFVKVENADDEGQNTDQLRALRLRMQTFPNHLLIDCSSPTTYGGAIYSNWKKGSREVWHLRCLQCGKLSPSNQLAFAMPDGSYRGLQWQKDDSGTVLDDSIRWVCPACGHAHLEADAKEMNRRGEYIPEAAASRDHRSFQAGALANPWLWPWKKIADAQENAVDANGRKFLANTIKGMPYKHTRDGDLSVSIPEVLASKRVDYPDDLSNRLSIVCAGIDQQSSSLANAKYYVYCVRGWDEKGNSWQLASGFANNTSELDKIVSATYHGLPIALALLDAGGFGDNASTTDPFVRAHTNVWYYKGGDDRTNSLNGKPWRFSDNIKNMVLANAIHYQVKLLDLLYGPPRTDGYQWRIPHTVSKAYLEQVSAMQPNNRMRSGNGESFNNWTPNSVRHDFFDAEKMSITALEVACANIPPNRFKRGNIPLFIRAEMLRNLVRSGLLKK